MGMCINKINGIRCKNKAVIGDIYCEKCKYEIKIGEEKNGGGYRIGEVVRKEKMFDIDRLKK